MPKMLVVARADLCLGYSLAGVEYTACLNRAEALEAIGRAVSSKEAGIVIVEQELLEGAEPRLLRDYRKSARPLIVPLPGKLVWRDAEEAPSDDLIAKLVRQAVGYRINIKL